MSHKWWECIPRNQQRRWQEASEHIGWWLESIFGLGIIWIYYLSQFCKPLLQKLENNCVCSSMQLLKAREVSLGFRPLD